MVAWMVDLVVVGQMSRWLLTCFLTLKRFRHPWQHADHGDRQACVPRRPIAAHHANLRRSVSDQPCQDAGRAPEGGHDPGPLSPREHGSRTRPQPGEVARGDRAVDGTCDGSGEIAKPGIGIDRGSKSILQPWSLQKQTLSSRKVSSFLCCLPRPRLQ